MLRTRFLALLMVSSALVLLATSAQGGASFNRVDILDVNDSSAYTDSGSSAPFVRAFMYADDDWASVWGSMSASARSANHLVQIFTYLYQPDSMVRNHRRAKANQKRFMYVQIWLRALPGNTLLARETDTVEGCKGSMKADDRDRDGNFSLSPTGDDTIRGRLRCPRGVLSDLGFSAGEVDTIQGIIGNRVRLNISLP